MDLNSENGKKLAKWIIGIATVCILIYLGVQNIDYLGAAVSWGIKLVMPLLLGIFFALILDVPVCFFERHLFKKSKKELLKKLKRPLSMVLALVLIIGVFAGIVGLVIPELINAVKIIIQGAVELFGKIGDSEAEALISKLPFGEMLYNNILVNYNIDWDKIGSTLQTWITEQGGNIMNTAVGTVSTLVSAVANFIIALIFAIYILVSKEKLAKQAERLIRAWIPEKIGKPMLHTVSVGLGIFRNFVSGQTLEALILGTLCIIGMLILRIPYAPMVGALIGVTAFIPVVGAFVGIAVGAFMILTVSPAKALVFVIYLLILQQIEGNIIYPKVMGDKINLPAIWVLAAVTIGGGIAGPFGMLLGVPVTSTIYVLLREETEKREKKLAEKAEAQEEKQEVQTEE
ncbi:MAG: AI-2E family transporter [Clostridia bacterium]|nr:AI-2E family transporter [Clostridia bacterium]